MRLLKREQSGWFTVTNKFRLTSFDPPRIPQYAILSHRWGPDEITFRDVENGTPKLKAGGLKKLEFCGEQAARDGLEYFWIDTCCIDKANNTELSEAINSMFKWYKNATKCYVYLPDVAVYEGASKLVTVNWESAFEQSQWFTRGWTLQELIAPAIVEFFSLEGRKLGDKKSLELQIHQITGIPVEALQGKPLAHFSQTERLSWSARRQTTVEEDAAYCLLGIFDIFMPLLYGEGQQKAVARLQREIRLSANPDLYIVKEAQWIVPFERNPLFTGREAQLAELEGKLFAKDHTSRIAIMGLGGIGKTQLVLELLYRTKEKHPDCSIIWIPAATIESLQQGYLVAAQQLDIPGYDNENADVKKLVQEYLSKDNAGPWLLVFDNADDIGMWMTAPPTSQRGDVNESSTEIAPRLIDYLPKNQQGNIVFTTRDRKAAVKFAQQNIITVPEMSTEVATQLLKKLLINPGLTDDTQAVSALLTTLTHLPLAIVQAAAYINTNDIILTDYISLLEEKEVEVINTLTEDFEDHGRYLYVKNPIATTWLISFEQIRHSDPLAAEYLSFIACVNPRDIPQSLLPPGPSRKKEIEAIGTLTAYSFVSRRSTNAALDIHRLVHLTTRNWLRKEEQLSQWTGKATGHLEKVFPNNNHSNRAKWRTYLPHAQEILASDLVSDSVHERQTLMWKCGMCLYSDGRWRDAETLFARLSVLETNRPNDEDSLALVGLGMLASAYRNQGRWKEAEQLEVRLIEARKATLGADHLYTLNNMSNLAVTYIDQGRWEEAEKLYKQVIEARNAKLGADDLEGLQNKSNLALAYWNMGRYGEAEQLYLQVINIRTMKLGANHPDTLMDRASLASTYRTQGRWKEAEQINVQVMEARKRILGPDHPDTLTSVHNLASTYWSQSRWDEAEVLFLEVLETRKKTLGPNHPDTLKVMVNLGSVYWGQGRLKESEQIDVQVLDIRKSSMGDDHPDTLMSMHNLAFTWENLGRYEEAIELMKDCVQRRNRVLGPTHPYTLSAKNALADWEAAHAKTNAEAAVAEDKS